MGTSAGEAGYFADDSMIRRVMRKRAVGLTYGLRALVVGAINPLLYVGTAEHSAHRDSPYTRLATTGALFEAVFLGSKTEADRALKFTKRKHASVVGTLPENAGDAHPAGTPYSAFDPDLLFMTMAFTFESAMTMHDLLVRKLTDTERADLYSDFVRWGELFGMPRNAAPLDYLAFDRFFQAYLKSAELFLTDEARLVGSYLAGHKRAYRLQPPAEQVGSALYLLVQGSLPARVRGLYGMDWSLTDEVAFQAFARGIRTAHVAPPLAPRVLANALAGRSAPSYQLIARREQRMIRAGRASMPGVDPRNWVQRNSA
ncbi:oxygenase MpaB family protein [Nocardia camponoti]|uniref:ER-bound oxygenase mpaB/mpaB'/Rubber oxygenase catalytic domain-containing protein n=1 Tax=Nocardia camponoti TaxID=1616106 RepID=A0A917QM31_9NOCA|nr:oxygenase MpaB family protein [Nocardia camponoti]GGK56660.1 hypothetical protein GCM10011591_30940 [Nocardia camponoti]